MIYKLKISRHSAGKHIPFAQVYIFEDAHFERVRQCFPALLGFRASQCLFDLESVRVHVTGDSVTRTTRTSCASAPTDDTTALTSLIPNFPSEDWHIAVPLLARGVPSREDCVRTVMLGSSREDASLLAAGKAELALRDVVNKEGNATPAYLREDRWKSRDRKNGLPAKAYPEVAYLATKDQLWSPICDACPRWFLHEMGHCEIGDAVCFLQLRGWVEHCMINTLSSYDTYVSSLNLPDLHPSEEEPYGVVSED